MKILRVLPALDYGGIERGVADFCSVACRAGHRVVVVAGPGRFVPAVRDAGAAWYNLPLDRKNLFVFLQARRRLAALIRREQPDIVHVQSRFPALVVSSLRGQFPAVPVVTSVHSLTKCRFYSRFLVSGDRVIVVSRFLADYVGREFHVPAEKIALVYNGVAAPGVSAGRCRRPGGVTVGMISRLSAGKGHHLFVGALALLAGEDPAVAGLIVGHGSRRRRRDLDNLLRDHGLAGRVRLQGGDGAALLKEMDILVVPSVQPEGFGRTVVEAQLAGVPVVATAIGAVPELIEHGRTGFLACPGDAADIARWVRHVAENPAVAEAVACHARKKALHEFSLEGMVSGTLAVYHTLVTARGDVDDRH